MALKGITDGLFMYKKDTDNTLPEGAGGFLLPWILHRPNNGLDVRATDVFFMYKRDDLINLYEGSEVTSKITGITESYVTNRPHKGLDVYEVIPLAHYRLHEGLDLRQLDVFALIRNEENVDSFKIPYGIGGETEAYAIYRVLLLAGYLHNFSTLKIKGIALENHYISLKAIETINRVRLENNTTEDLKNEKEG